MKKKKYQTISLWPAGEDLPLFSGVCITVHFKPFIKTARPPIPYLQLKFSGYLPLLTMAELAEIHPRPSPASVPRTQRAESGPDKLTLFEKGFCYAY